MINRYLEQKTREGYLITFEYNVNLGSIAVTIRKDGRYLIDVIDGDCLLDDSKLLQGLCAAVAKFNSEVADER